MLVDEIALIFWIGERIEIHISQAIDIGDVYFGFGMEARERERFVASTKAAKVNMRQRFAWSNLHSKK